MAQMHVTYQCVCAASSALISSSGLIQEDKLNLKCKMTPCITAFFSFLQFIPLQCQHLLVFRAHLCPLLGCSGGCADVPANDWISFRKWRARSAEEEGGGGGKLQTFQHCNKRWCLSTAKFLCAQVDKISINNYSCCEEKKLIFA